jgi:hypothetical protein
MIAYEYEECEGCRTYTGNGLYNDGSPECCLYKPDECPCRICIVKSMCADPCEPFIGYEQRYNYD